MTPHSLKKYVCTAALAALASACGSDAINPTITPVNSHSDALAEGSATQWLNESISKRRFIGVKKSGSDTNCPEAPGPFQVRPLFSTDNDNLQPGWALSNFCLYEAGFDQQLVDLDGDGILDAPEELASLICQQGNNPISVTNNVQPDCLEKVSPDRFAVGGHASANPKGQLATVMAPLFESEFLSHAGYVATLPPSQHETQTRLAFLDTSRTENAPGLWASYRRWGQRNSDHGLMMTRIGEKLACGDGTHCMARITSQLAMPYKVEYQYETTSTGDIATDSYGVKIAQKDAAGNAIYNLVEDTNKGGHLGTISYLGEAIYKEVAAYEAGLHQPGNGRQRLVVNLSLAWMPEYGGDIPAGFNGMDPTSKELARLAWPADVQAAYVAIRDARCKGALLIAASGNDSGGNAGNSDPMLPAAWEEINAPRSVECNLHRYGTLTSPNGSSFNPHTVGYTPTPLLYAASGITRQGADISNQRDGARTRFTTYADHATLQDFREKWSSHPLFSGSENMLHIKPHTGTSVSSAVLATVAATVWSYQPHLSADELMTAIYETGDTIDDGSGSPVIAEFCHDGGSACAEQSVRITMCNAVYGLDANNDGFADINGEDPEVSIEDNCTKWDDLLAISPDAYETALPATASSASITPMAPSSFETASTNISHSYWPKYKHDASCGNNHDENFPWSNTTGSWQYDSNWCPEQQFYNQSAAPWTIPQPEGGGSDCGGACSMFPSFDMVSLSGSINLGTVVSPTLSITNTSGVTSNYSLSGLSGFSMNIGFSGLSTMNVKSASFGGSTGSYSFSSPLYIGF